VYEHLSEVVKERQRERAKKDQLDFQKRERKKRKKFQLDFQQKRKKTYFPTLKKLISPLCENLFPCKHKYPTDGTALEHIKLF
jgi:hypothetical protein